MTTLTTLIHDIRIHGWTGLDSTEQLWIAFALGLLIATGLYTASLWQRGQG